ncbi:MULTISPECIES: DUF6221 family protein [unclassified Serinicoccus]|jgi:hypothetical protein|uniref:DUF6221 family protein n=1 Tax=unclassified Serinicoccus TaxID=2643101 RepID=UPI003855236B
MSELVSFLRARLDEDERTGLDAVRIRSDVYKERAVDPDHDVAAWDDHPAGVVIVGPERWLREVAIKRAILAAAVEDVDARGAEREWANYTLSELASVYVNHPDYRPEWAPDLL